MTRRIVLSRNLLDRSAASAIASAALVLGLSGVSVAQMAFDPAVGYAVGSHPEGGMLLDFTGDGRLDLVVTSENPDKLQFFVNLGPGVFGAPVSLATGNGTSPEGVAAGDFDGDGDVDLATALFSAAQVQLILGDGAGHFSLGAKFAVQTEPSMIVAADFNADGRPDVAVNNRVSGTMSVLLNNGSGGFVSAVHYPVGAETRCIAVGNITSDALPDLVVSSRDDRRVRVFRNIGGGAFQILIDLSLGAILEPQGVALADFDSDGRLDVVTATSGTNPGQEHPSVFLQKNGGNPWVGPINGSTLPGLAPTGIATADFDLDGHVDVVTANADSNDVSVCKNGGIGIFFLPVVFAVGQNPEALVMLTGDLDGNGGSDLVTINRDSDDVSVLMNQTSAGDPVIYCTAKITSNGCLPQIGWSGVPSVSASSGFFVTASSFINNKAGLFFYSTTGMQAVPFQGGTLCVKTPIKRTPGQNSSGNPPPNDCSGTYNLDFNAYAASASDPALNISGTMVFGQYWARDPQSASTTSLSNAVRFTMNP